MKASSPFIVRLVAQTKGLRERAIAEGAVTQRQVDDASGHTARPPLRTLLSINRALECVLTMPGGWGVLDDRNKLLLKALDDDPVPVEGTQHFAYSKSYRSLQYVEALWLKANHISFSATANVELEKFMEFVRQALTWGFVTEEHGWPNFEAGADVIPDWVKDIPHAAAHAAFLRANTERCEAILQDHMRLVDPTATTYVPAVFQFLADETLVPAEQLMERYSYAFCLALADFAQDLKGELAHVG